MAFLSEAAVEQALLKQLQGLHYVEKSAFFKHIPSFMLRKQRFFNISEVSC